MQMSQLSASQVTGSQGWQLGKMAMHIASSLTRVTRGASAVAIAASEPVSGSATSHECRWPSLCLQASPAVQIEIITSLPLTWLPLVWMGRE